MAIYEGYFACQGPFILRVNVLKQGMEESVGDRKLK